VPFSGTMASGEVKVGAFVVGGLGGGLSGSPGHRGSLTTGPAATCGETGGWTVFTLCAETQVGPKFLEVCETAGELVGQTGAAHGGWEHGWAARTL